MLKTMMSIKNLVMIMTTQMMMWKIPMIMMMMMFRVMMLMWKITMIMTMLREMIPMKNLITSMIMKLKAVITQKTQMMLMM